MVNQELQTVVSLDITPEEAQAAIEAIAAQKVAKEALLATLAKDIEGKLTSRMGTRKAKENQWLEAMRLTLGSLSTYNIVTNEYPFGTKNDKTIVHTPEVNITRTKCEAAIAQTIAYQFAAGEKNWSINPPSVIDLDQHDIMSIQQMYPQQEFSLEDIAAIRCNLMEKQIEYHLDATNYGVETRKAIKDRVILGTGILKGPLNAGKNKRIYKKAMDANGQPIRVPTYTIENTPLIYRVNPWYFFPDDTVSEIDKAEDSIEVHPLSKADLEDLLKHPGFIADAIAECVAEEPRSYVNSPFNDPAYLTQGINLLKNKYLVAEYHGPLKREDLTALDLLPAVDDNRSTYYGEVWVCNGRVIRISLENIEGCQRIPYCVSVWEPDPASPFGFGIPMLTRDQQKVVNETWKMMLDNAGISAGPQVIIDTTLIKPAEGGLECTPWKVWYSTEYGADVSKAITFYVPPNNYEGLSQLFSMTKALADEESSVPLMLSGLSLPTGGADNATQTAIMNQNATSPLFYKSEEWDDQMTRPIIEMMYAWEMQYNPDDTCKGTYEIDVRTSTSYLRSSMEQQKLERLAQEVAQGSPTGEWINMDALTIARLSGMKLPYRGIVKTPEQVRRERQNKQPPPPDPNMIKAQAEMERVQVDKQRLELDQQRLQMEQTLKFQEAQMEYEAQLRTDAVRQQEAQASVLKAQYDYQGQMAALAAKSDVDRAKIVAQLQSSEADRQTQRFLAGMEMAARAKDQQQRDKELSMKERGGTGVTSVR